MGQGRFLVTLGQSVGPHEWHVFEGRDSPSSVIWRYRSQALVMDRDQTAAHRVNWSTTC